MGRNAVGAGHARHGGRRGHPLTGNCLYRRGPGMPGPYRAAATGCLGGVKTAPPGGQTLAGWPVGAAYMPPGTFAAAGTPRAAYMRPLQTVPKNDVYGWFVGEG